LTPEPTNGTDVIIVGAGHAGLSAAAALHRRGLRVLLAEQEERVGRPWLARYSALRLNTERWGSRLPGLKMARGDHRWPSATEFASYLAAYAARQPFEIRFRTEVTRIDISGTAYVARTPQGDLHGTFVVLATGPDRLPRLPSWPGLADWQGEVLHSAGYREPGPYRGRSVLVVGGGESAADIAGDLVRGGAGAVSLAIRTPPYIQQPSVLGIPAQALAIMATRQPPWLFDMFAELSRRATTGDLSGYGLFRPPSLHQTARVQGKAPILDRGFVQMVRSGAIRIHPAVTGTTAHEVQLADGSTARPDVLLLATGFEPGLGPVVGHLGVLAPDGRPTVAGSHTDARAPGLFFAGYTPELAGNIREGKYTAARIAKEIAIRARARGETSAHRPVDISAPH